MQGFKQGNSCVCRLSSITHEMYQSFDNGFEVRGTFLESPKLLIKSLAQRSYFHMKTKWGGG